MTDREITEAVAAMDPVCHSTEGLDDGCHFCGGDMISVWGRGMTDYRCGAAHLPSCVWVLACYMVDKPIEYPNVVTRPSGLL